MNPPWLAVAYQELRTGITEIRGPQSNPRIVSYWTALGGIPIPGGGDEVPWCAAFVAWCLEEAGVKHSGLPNARSYLNWGVPLHPVYPATGSIMVIRQQLADPGPDVHDVRGHVTFFWDHAEPGWFLGLGGNQSDGVTIAKYPNALLLGVRWPTGR